MVIRRARDETSSAEAGEARLNHRCDTYLLNASLCLVVLTLNGIRQNRKIPGGVAFLLLAATPSPRWTHDHPRHLSFSETNARMTVSEAPQPLHAYNGGSTVQSAESVPQEGAATEKGDTANLDSKVGFAGVGKTLL